MKKKRKLLIKLPNKEIFPDYYFLLSDSGEPFQIKHKHEQKEKNLEKIIEKGKTYYSEKSGNEQRRYMFNSKKLEKFKVKKQTKLPIPTKTNPPTSERSDNPTSGLDNSTFEPLFGPNSNNDLRREKTPNT